MTEGSNKSAPYMAPGLIRDKVADRFTTLNPSIRITQLSGQDLRDQIGRAMLRETQDLYTLWQQQDTEGILRKSADTLEIILAGLKLHGLDQNDLLQARQDRLNAFGAFDQGRFLQGSGPEPGPWSMDDIPRFFFTPTHADRLIHLIRSELDRSERAWIASAFYSPGVTNLLISSFDRPGNTFSIKTELAPYWNAPFFRDLVADRVRFAMTRYFSRKAQVADIIYNDAILTTGFPVRRDFALAFYAENPLKIKSTGKNELTLEPTGNRAD